MHELPSSLDKASEEEQFIPILRAGTSINIDEKKIILAYFSKLNSK
jgi:hypothetical protein